MGIKSYSEGYESAMSGVERCIDSSIERNGGAMRPEQVVLVMNDVIAYIHKEKTALQPQGQQEHEEYTLVYAIQDEQGGVWL